VAKPISVLIADDHTIVRSGVRLLLDSESEFHVVGEAVDGLEALALVESLHPDVVLMDVSMPGMGGLEATREIKARWPDVKVLVLTMHRSDEYFYEMLKAGASGYVLKAAQPGELLLAVRVVGRGEMYLYPTMAGHLVRDFLEKQNNPVAEGLNLSPREKEILNFLAKGYSSKEIAELLVISPSTVHTHRSNLMTKLGFNNLRELVQYAREHGLIQG
jgi:two-component system response regulator NreC